MNLLKIVRNIQYQTAKIEVIELLFSQENADNSSLTTEINYNLVSTLRQHLFAASEACFDATPETLPSCIATLQDTLSSAREFLVKINTDSISLQIQFPILKGLIADISTNLNQLNTALNRIETQPQPQVLIQNSDNSISVDNIQTDSNSVERDVESKTVDNRLEVLMNLCDNDGEKAEFWIQFEQARNPELSRKEAIESAITIKTNLEDKSNLFLIIQKVVTKVWEMESEKVTWDEPVGCGVDWLDISELVIALETELSIEFPQYIEFTLIAEVDSLYAPPGGYKISDGRERYYNLCTTRQLIDLIYQQIQDSCNTINVPLATPTSKPSDSDFMTPAIVANTTPRNKIKDIEKLPEIVEFESRFDLLNRQYCTDDESAESWIEFEQTRNPELSREDAIESAIKINSDLKDKANILLIIHKIICEYLEVKANEIKLDFETPIENLYLYLDSFDSIEIAYIVEEKFNIHIPDGFIGGIDLPGNTIGENIDLMLEQMQD